MASIISLKENSPATDFQDLSRIRQKFREVFGCENTMSDEALIRRYRVTGEGDLIMILR
jgi:hypothetical protein